MVSHFAREIREGSMAMFPQLMQTARGYFNVTQGYVLRKALWQLAPMNMAKKKSGEGEIGAEKDWGVRVVKGLEVDIEAPDAYIPTMGFVTYVLLYCLVQGLEERFNPDVLGSTLTFALVILVLETAVVKGALFLVGAADAPVMDVAALMGYKYYHLSLQLGVGLLVGGGWKPQGFLYKLFSLVIFGSCGAALWQVLRRLPRLQPARSSQECGPDMHKILIKVLPVLEVLICWLLLPSWSKRPLGAKSSVKEVVQEVTTTVVALALNSSDTGAAAAQSHRVEG
uniref:Protein YIF1 n=1 Tax=Alexandrium catenella TaxID=2925 RepID=A0A7S1MBZ8_ALECA